MRYALNFSFTNGNIICVVVETNLSERLFRRFLTRQMKKDIAYITDVNRVTYMIPRDKLNYFMCSELQENAEECEPSDGIRDSEVETEEASHPET